MSQSPSILAIGFALGLALVGGGTAARGDLIELSGGGRIEGRIVEQSPARTGSLVIETASGGQLTLARSQVVKIRTTSDAEREYQARARTTPDTVEAHWELAEWCREQRLRNQSQQHLARILELDPDHVDARTLLGFRNQAGEWRTRDDVMASRGLVLYEGKYLSPQHIELLEQQKETKLTQADWISRLNLLRRFLTGRRQDRVESALAEIAAIRDPLAAEPVVALLNRENDPELRRLWIDVAGRLNHHAAIDALVNLSIYDDDEEVRIQCLEHLARGRHTGLTRPYVRALKNKDNEIINRAATALGQLGERDAISPLIDALVTTHRFQIGGGNPDQQAYTFSPDGGAFSFGGGGPKFEDRPIRNPAVLSALVRLSGGANFDFDQARWRAWLAAQAKKDAIDVRRDE